MIYLITGSMNLFARSIARRVGANGYRANSTLRFNMRGELRDIGYKKDQGKRKVLQIKQLARRLGIPVTEIYYIGDGENDREAFLLTSKGVLLTKKKETSLQSQWKINALEDILEICI